MEENIEMPILDFSELVEYIQGKTGFQKEVIESVLDSETDYMIHIGIIANDKE